MDNRISSKQKNKDKAKRDHIASVIFLVIAGIGILATIFYDGEVCNSLFTSDRIIDMNTGKVVKEDVILDAAISEEPNISYPGYEKLIFMADSKKQEVYLTNPKDNTCYFMISIILEDGTVIWQSDGLMPGNAYDRISLRKILEEGIYDNAVLQYESYSLKDGRKLNGSSINLIIEVN